MKKGKSRCDNTSGFRGVYHTSKGNYRVSIGFQKQRYYVGTYPTFEQAVQARLKAEELIHNGFLKAYRLWSDQAKKEPLWAKKNPFRFQVEKKDGKLFGADQRNGFGTYKVKEQKNLIGGSALLLPSLSQERGDFL